jgi:hypothetical protein
MGNDGRKVGYYAAAGIMIAALIIGSLFLSGVQFPGISGPSVEAGTLVALLTDAPANLSELLVTIDSFSVQKVDEGWVPIPFGSGMTEVSFDLIKLNNVTMKLANATIEVGNYTKMRMTIKDANATFAGDDPEFVILTVPPGHIDIIIRFEVKSDGVTVVLIDMEADWVAISNNHHLRPVLKAEVAS